MILFWLTYDTSFLLHFVNICVHMFSLKKILLFVYKCSCHLTNPTPAYRELQSTYTTEMTMLDQKTEYPEGHPVTFDLVLVCRGDEAFHLWIIVKIVQVRHLENPQQSNGSVRSHDPGGLAQTLEFHKDPLQAHPVFTVWRQIRKQVPRMGPTLGALEWPNFGGRNSASCHTM